MTTVSVTPATTGTSDDRFLRILDDPRYRVLVDLQDLISYETAVFWRQRAVKCLHLPITTNSVSSPMGLGSDSLPVCVDLFGVPTFLADSMQFMLEYGCRLSRKGSYYLMPSFRGEETDATHLNQFFHSEAEIPGGLDDVIAVADAYLRHIAAAALVQVGPALTAVAGTTRHIEDLLARPSARLTFDDAVSELGGKPAYFTDNGSWRTITRAGERELIARFGPAVWLTHFDHLSVPFYQAYDETGQKALNADLLLGPGEVIGCGQRHVTGAETLDALRRHEVPSADYDWYVRMKAEHPMATSGFGMGIERVLMWLLQHDDIRDMQILERYNGRLTTP
ncbi:amino acid--tRNA ligase-related protein [Streptomyces sp. NBC_00582]|uniref:amino acid--tRNA ligase-related protein n=1 Tax=Streptomyces sp. NBC_00582 TaxID=2975783 RepID=UPI001063ECA1|nr:amino acid--tRNA ligase-related protein [Streptomyces sp. NBC_00582]WUB59214.1 asparaginase [Streptomyces sp. NBC_00582]